MTREWNETDLGYVFENEELFVFFGKKPASLERLRETYPEFEIKNLHQVHGDEFVSAADSNHDTKADAHWTDLTNQALAIKTADCAPVFFYSQSKGIIAAVHAGWRGVASQLISKVILQLAYKGVQFKEFEVFVGPHIGVDHFEVDSDVKKELLASIPHMNDKDMRKSEVYRDQESGKTLIDISKIIKAQLDNFSIPEERIHFLKRDSFADTSLHSHRRDREKAGRQLSFILRKK